MLRVRFSQVLGLFRERRRDEELDEEMRSHLEMATEENLRRGMSPEEARQAARRSFGGVEQVKETYRDARGILWLEEPWRDLLYAVRGLWRNPGFTVVAALTIALGIGASTAIFSVADAVLLKPLPYREPDRLVSVWMDLKERGVRDRPFSHADFIDLRDGSASVFDDMAALMTFRVIVPRGNGRSERIYKAQVTTTFFRLMGARIAHGRDFSDVDAQPRPSGQGQGLPVGSVAILSHEYWQRRYGGDTAVIGQEMLTFGQRGLRIIGVLEPGFELLFPPATSIERKPDVWIANDVGYDRSVIGLQIVGRLAHGISMEQAQESVELVAADWRQNRPELADQGMMVRLEPMDGYLVAAVRPAILSLMGAAIFLLLIACANVANLFLVRVSRRERELAVRTVLGGSRWRLIRQTLTEAALLAGLGTLLGVWLAWLGTGELLGLVPANLPRLESVAIDWRVVAFAAIAGLATAAIFGALPALRAARPDVAQLLRGGGRTATLGAGRLLRNGVVVVEVALTFALLIGSGLMFRSFVELRQVDPGYSPQKVLTFLLVRDWDYGSPAPQRVALLRQIQDRLRAVPGIESVTAAVLFPLTRAFPSMTWDTEEAAADPAQLLQAANGQIVMPDYFETLGTPLMEGRTFTDDDNAAGRKIAIIDQSLATKAFPNESAVGKRIRILWFGEAQSFEIIGVVAHQHFNSLSEPGREQVYLTDGFAGFGVGRTWAVRTNGDPASFAPVVRTHIEELDPQLLISELQPMDALVERAQSETRFSLLLIGTFAVVAALLTAVGLYGVLSNVVRQRTAEIGVRMALGAAPAGIFRLVVTRGLLLSAAGIAGGLVLALLLTRLMTSMLVGVTPTDPATFAAMAVVFFLIAAVVSWLPARRASMIDPTEALRTE